MTALLGIQSLAKSFGTQTLFEGLSFTVSSGDRIGLLGPNGSGKSTLLKIIMGLEPADNGAITKRQGLKIGYASQSPDFPSESLENVLLQQEGLKGDEIELLTRARILLGKAQFDDPLKNAQSLSGGWKKRLDIARALMLEPDLLLLDEPTNHLDLEGILWLEKLLLREKTSYIIVSHDRYFLENISNKIIELNRCFPQNLFMSEGNLSAYMERKEEFLEAQAQEERGLASVVREEVEWLKKSPKARTTKSRSRIQKAYELLDELSQIKARNKTTKIDFEFSASERDTRKLITCKNLTKSLGEKPLFKGVELTLSPGTRLGIVGKNGTGKTTLLKILAGEIKQDMGTMKYADNLKLVYFDQHREHIPSDISLKEALAPTSDMVNYRGQFIHVNGWAKKFLFSPDRLSLPVGCLSGGERARILISKLMLQPADILFLDEPTNDLDIQTLELIEESLKEFFGAVVLISHDRCLMDRVCTEVLGLGENNEHEIFADYSQWEQSSNFKKTVKNEAPKKEEPTKSAPVKTAKKLSYKEQKELESMEANIDAVDSEIAKIQAELENNLNISDAQKSLELYRQLADAQKKQESLFERWQYLENITK